jgi:hypothetical protein
MNHPVARSVRRASSAVGGFLNRDILGYLGSPSDHGTQRMEQGGRTSHQVPLMLTPDDRTGSRVCGSRGRCHAAQGSGRRSWSARPRGSAPRRFSARPAVRPATSIGGSTSRWPQGRRPLEHLPQPGQPRPLRDADRPWILGQACQKPRACGCATVRWPHRRLAAPIQATTVARRHPAAAHVEPARWGQFCRRRLCSPSRSPRSGTPGSRR